MKLVDIVSPSPVILESYVCACVCVILQATTVSSTKPMEHSTGKSKYSFTFSSYALYSQFPLVARRSQVIAGYGLILLLLLLLAFSK